jgi:hypothetical protein
MKIRFPHIAYFASKRCSEIWQTKAGLHYALLKKEVKGCK